MYLLGDMFVFKVECTFNEQVLKHPYSERDIRIILDDTTLFSNKT